MKQVDKEPLNEVIRLLEQAIVALRRYVDSDEERVHVPGQGYWTQDMFDQVGRAVLHLPGVTALFDLTAERAAQVAVPDRVSFSEVLARSGLDEPTQRTSHARLSRISRSIIGSTSWPVEGWQDHVTNEMQYRMPRAIAQWWLDLRKVAPTLQ